MVKIEFLGRMEADPNFNKEVIGIDGEDVRKAKKELVQYNIELGLGLAVPLFCKMMFFWTIYFYFLLLLFRGHGVRGQGLQAGW